MIELPFSGEGARLSLSKTLKNIRLKRSDELVARDFLNPRLHVLLTRVVDQDVNGRKGLAGLADDIVAEGFVADIPCDQQTLRPLFFYILLRLFGILMLIKVNDDHISAFLRE